MGIEVSIGIGVVHTMHNGIGAGTEVRRTLHEIGKYEKEFFPSFAHLKSPVRSIPVLEECLGEQG